MSPKECGTHSSSEKSKITHLCGFRNTCPLIPQKGSCKSNIQKYCIQKLERILIYAVLNFDLQTILLSPKFHCTEEILTIVSLLSVDSVLYNPPSRRDEVQGVRKKFTSSEGDHITLLNIYRTFKNIGGNKVNFISFIFSADPSFQACGLSGSSLFWLNHQKSHKKNARCHFRNICVQGQYKERNVISAFHFACV